MSAALATVDTRHALARPMISAEILTAEAEQRKLLGQYIATQMTPDVDYGIIPGTKNKTLLKPGAEKLTDLFRCVPQFTILEKIEDWDKGLFHYQFKCEIVVRESNMVVAEGYGSCSTREGKYRWRNDERKCPSCGAAAIMKSKYPPRNAPEEPPGFYCFQKKGGCGVEFAHDDTAIVDQRVGKIENPDVADQVNTVLKMAKKRAHVDAAISLARCSDMFTQDAEDFVDNSSAQQPAKTADQPPQNGTPAVNSAEIAGRMIEAINSDEFTKDRKGLWASMAHDYDNVLAKDDKAKVHAEWVKRVDAVDSANVDPVSSAKLLKTMTASIQECKSIADLDQFGKLVTQNHGKLTADDKKLLFECGKNRRAKLVENEKLRAEHGPGAEGDE